MIISKTLQQFIIRSAIIFLSLGAICAAVFVWFAPQHYFNAVPFIFLYFFLLNLVVFRFLIGSNDLHIHKFSQKFLIFTSVKFFGSLIFVVAFLLLSKENAIPFLLIFITLYVVSLIQEVYEFLRFLKKRNV